MTLEAERISSWAMFRHPGDQRERRMDVDAWFAANRARRLLISVRWGAGPRLPWIMLNPSLAGSGITKDNLDPTLRQVRSFTIAEGFEAFDVVNLYDLIDPSPRGLLAEDPRDLGPNRSWLADVAHGSGPVVVAWGAHAKARARAEIVVRDILEPAGAYLEALTVTKDGHPGHPLYLPHTLRLATWRSPWPR